MSVNGRSNADDRLVLTLAAGQTIQAAAEVASVSEMTVYRRLRKYSFRAKVTAARRQITSRAIGRLASVYTDAVDALAKLLASESESIRLSAAKAILETRLNDVARAERETEEHEREKAEDRRRGLGYG